MLRCIIKHLETWQEDPRATRGIAAKRSVNHEMTAAILDTTYSQVAVRHRDLACVQQT
jgi:hypothetical protein